MIVPLGHVFLLAGIVFAMGLICLVAHRNLIMTLIGVEVMMNAAAIAFVAAALRWRLMEGQAFVLFILAVSAAEISLGWRWSSACIDEPALSIRTVTTS